jgi:uncharacterized membrane protein
MSATQLATDTQMADGLGWFSIGLGVAEVAAPDTVAQLIGLENGSQTRAVLRAYGAREIATGIGILSSRPHPAWLWARVAGDVLDLATLGLASRRGSYDPARLTSAFASVAGVMAADVATARRLSHTSARGYSTDLVWKAFTVNHPPEEVAARWADLDPLGDIVESIRFDPAPGGQGTEVRVAFKPGWFGRTSARTVQEKLRRFKQLVETGEVARSSGRSRLRQPAQPLPGRNEAFAEVGGQS